MISTRAAGWRLAAERLDANTQRFNDLTLEMMTRIPLLKNSSFENMTADRKFYYLASCLHLLFTHHTTNKFNVLFFSPVFAMIKELNQHQLGPN